MSYYTVTFLHTKLIRWGLRLPAHVKYLNQMIDDGTLQVSGPLKVARYRAAMLIFQVPNRSTLDHLVENDPYSLHGLVAKSTVNEWQINIGSLAKPADTSDSTNYFIVTYAIAKDAEGEKNPNRQQNYLTTLYEKHQLRAAGTYPGSAHQREGMYILAAANREEATKLMANDPGKAVKSAHYSLTPWDPRFGSFK